MDKTKEYINMMITNRESIIKNVFSISFWSYMSYK
jgi:hypothetical protein